MSCSSAAPASDRRPRPLRVRHPLVRRAVYESSGGGWRRPRTLAPPPRCGRGAAAAQRARHVEESAAHGDAGRSRCCSTPPPPPRRARRAAAHWFEAALRLQAGDDRAAQLRIRIGLAQALRSTGDLEGCGGISWRRSTWSASRSGRGSADRRGRGGGALPRSPRGGDLQLEAAFAGLSDRSPRRPSSSCSRRPPGRSSRSSRRGCASSRQALGVARARDPPILVFASASALAHACANAGAVRARRPRSALAAELMDGAGRRARPVPRRGQPAGLGGSTSSSATPTPSATPRAGSLSPGGRARTSSPR